MEHTEVCNVSKYTNQTSYNYKTANQEKRLYTPLLCLVVIILLFMLPA